MKKQIITFGLGTMLLIFASCGQTGKSSDGASDEAKKVDSIESTSKQSVAPSDEQAKANPETDLTLKVVKKDLKYVDEASSITGNLMVEITNNGKATISGSKYEVTYKETIEEEVGGDGFEEITKTRSVAGKDIEPGASVTIKLPASQGCQDISSPAIKAI